MNEQREKEKNETLDLLLATTYCCSQTHLSQQLSQLHPELTMPMFSGTLFHNILLYGATDGYIII